MGKPAQLAKAEIDAIVYECRQSGKDTTYDIVNLALARAGIAADNGQRAEPVEALYDDALLSRTYLKAINHTAGLRAVYNLAAPAAAVQPTRDEVLEEAALICEDRHYNWKWDDEPDSNSGPRECAAAIRASKSAAATPEQSDTTKGQA